MNLIELNRALRQLRLGGIAAVLETRLQQAQAEPMTPIDFLSCLVSDELTRRGDRLLERRRKQAQFRDPHRTLDNFDFNFNKKMNRSLVFDLATAAFVGRREDALFLGPPGTGKSHLAQGLAHEACRRGYDVLFVWATAANTFFSRIVRIQPERGHTVVTGGPYRYVRHPAYAGAILYELAVPFLLASWPALAASGLSALLLILRTALEDRTLQAELTGYVDYVRQVRYRLLPGIW